MSDTKLPEMGAAKACSRTDCPAPVFGIGYGLAGGGYGAYEYCDTCGQIVSKASDLPVGDAYV